RVDSLRGERSFPNLVWELYRTIAVRRVRLGSHGSILRFQLPGHQIPDSLANVFAFVEHGVGFVDNGELCAVTGSSRFGDAVEEAFAAEVEFAVHDGRGGAEGVFETVDGQDGVFAVVAEDDGCSVATGDVDAAGGADGRRKDE